MKRYAAPNPGSQNQGDTLRKCSSYDLIGRRNAVETDSSDSSQGGTRLNLLAHSASLSSMKRESRLTVAENPMATPTPKQGPKPSQERFAQFRNDDGDVFNGGEMRAVFSAGNMVGNDSLGSTSSGSRNIVTYTSRHNAARDETETVDAQEIYPSTACLFVANLASSVSDETLEDEVKKAFEKYGVVFVKLRRDTRNMPYAFVQYTSDRDAQRAFDNAQGIRISDRSCRVEKAKANSIFAVSKKSKEHISEEEAANLLRPLGKIAEVKPLDWETQQKLHLPQSILVQFTLFDSVRDPVRVFKDHRFYRVTSLEPGKAAVANTPTAMKRDLINRRSVFIGDLPTDCTEDEVRELAIACGQVLSVKVRTRAYALCEGEICFAFVEFDSPESVQDMIATYDGVELRGNRLRLEQRQSRAVVTLDDPITPTPRQAGSRFGSTPSSSRAAVSESWRGKQPSHEVEYSLQTPPTISDRVYPSSDRVRTGNRRGDISSGSRDEPTSSFSSSVTPQRYMGATSAGPVAQAGPSSATTVDYQDALLKYLEETSEQANIRTQTMQPPSPNEQQALVPVASAHTMPYGIAPYFVAPYTPLSPFAQQSGFLQSAALSPLAGPYFHSPYGGYVGHGYMPYGQPQPRSNDQGTSTSRGDETPTRAHYARRRRESNSRSSPSHSHSRDE